MKKIAMVFALVLALICSQACAQKKTDSAEKTKASSKAAPTASLAVSKKSKDSSKELSQDESEKSKRNSKQSSTEKAASKSGGSDELTDDQQKKIKSMLRQTLKPFVAVELTEEQRQKADEMLGKAVKDYVVKRSKAQITAELQKKHAAAMKEQKSSGKNAREQAKEAFATAGFSEEQTKVFKATQASLNKAKRDFGKELTQEQLDLLPAALQAILSGEEKP